MGISIDLLKSLVEGLTGLLQPEKWQETEMYRPLPSSLATKVFVPPPRLSHPVLYTAKQLLVSLIQEKEPQGSREGRGESLEKGRPQPLLPPVQKKTPLPAAYIQQTAEELVIEVKQAIRLLPLFLAQPKSEEVHKTLGKLKPLIDLLIEAVERGETATAGEGEEPPFAKPLTSRLAKHVSAREISFPKREKSEPVLTKRVESKEAPAKGEKIEQVKSQHVNPPGSALKTDAFIIFDRTAISAAPFSSHSSIDRREKKKKKEKYWPREEEEEKKETP